MMMIIIIIMMMMMMIIIIMIIIIIIYNIYIPPNLADNSRRNSHAVKQKSTYIQFIHRLIYRVSRK